MFTATPVVRIFLAKSQSDYRVLGKVTSTNHQHKGILTVGLPESEKIPGQINLADTPAELHLSANLGTSYTKIWSDWHEVLNDLMKALANSEQLYILLGPVPGCPNWELIPVDTFQGEPRLGCSTNYPCAA